MIQLIKDELLKQGITIDSDEELINYFNSNFKNVLTFCKENNVEIIIDDQEKELLDAFVQSNRSKSKGKIDSLDEIMLVHKTTGIPSNDKIVSASEQEYDDYSKFLEKGLECDDETLSYLGTIELAPNMDKKQALGYQLLYIQNNSKRKEQETQKQELNEETINPTMETAREENQAMNKFNKIENQKQNERKDQIKKLQELKQEVEKQQKQEIINNQIANVEKDSDITEIGR